MSTVIVDTDVVSFLMKGDTRAALYRSHLEGRILALSFMTVAELYQWAYIRNWGERKVSRLEEQMHKYLIVPYNGDLCKTWARICADRQRMGHPISIRDAWIAATALVHSCPLVTHNRGDFADIPGLHLISHG